MPPPRHLVSWAATGGGGATSSYGVEQRRAGFTVYAPAVQRYDKQIQGMVNRYKLALTSYRVLFVAAPPR